MRIVGGKKYNSTHHIDDREIIEIYSDNELLKIWNEYYENIKKQKEIFESTMILTKRGIYEYKRLKRRNKDIKNVLDCYNIQV